MSDSKNEYVLSELCSELSNINNEIQSSADNYNNYQAELYDSMNRYEALCNKLTIISQRIPSKHINIMSYRKLVKNKKSLRSR